MAKIDYNSFEELIRAYVIFTGAPSNGWHPCYCEHCGDGSRTKGPRGGWLFTADTAFYKCFNQGCEGSYVEDRDHPLSHSMSDVMESFGVPLKEYKMFQLRHLKDGKKTSDSGNKPRLSPILKLDVPSHFYLLSEADDDDAIAAKAKRFLTKRKIDWTTYPYYLSTGKAKKSEGVEEVENAKRLKDRLIIPAFKGSDLIYWQARDLEGTSKKKYISASTPRSNVIYGMDKLYENVQSPLFVTEGFFDSVLVNGVAVMENSLTSQQVELLKRSPRRKVIIPDRKGDSKKLVDDAIAAGFGISVPNWGGEKDVNDAVLRFGRLYVAQSIIDNVKFGVAAKIVAGMFK